MSRANGTNPRALGTNPRALRGYTPRKSRRLAFEHDGGVRAGMRFKVFERDGFTCQYCGARPPDVRLHVDHIFPRSKGGRWELDNLRTACEACNIGKSDRLISEVCE